MSTVSEEKEFNPRLTKTKEEFIEIMNNLNLFYPEKIGEAHNFHGEVFHSQPVLKYNNDNKCQTYSYSNSCSYSYKNPWIYIFQVGIYNFKVTTYKFSTVISGEILINQIDKDHCKLLSSMK